LTFPELDRQIRFLKLATTYAHGLERYDEQENGQSLRKMKAVGGVQ
jgi:hypothetical protein